MLGSSITSSSARCRAPPPWSAADHPDSTTMTIMHQSDSIHNLRGFKPVSGTVQSEVKSSIETLTEGKVCRCRFLDFKLQQQTPPPSCREAGPSTVFIIIFFFLNKITTAHRPSTILCKPHYKHNALVGFTPPTIHAASCGLAPPPSGEAGLHFFNFELLRLHAWTGSAAAKQENRGSCIFLFLFFCMGKLGKFLQDSFLENFPVS